MLAIIHRSAVANLLDHGYSQSEAIDVLETVQPASVYDGARYYSPRTLADLCTRKRLSQLAEQAELARGFETLTKGATKRAFRRKARQLHNALCTLYPVSSEVAAMSDAELLAELRGDAR
jgi:hypothetical protein